MIFLFNWICLLRLHVYFWGVWSNYFEIIGFCFLSEKRESGRRNDAGWHGLIEGNPTYTFCCIDMVIGLKEGNPTCTNFVSQRGSSRPEVHAV